MRAIHNPDAAIKRTPLYAKIRDQEADANPPIAAKPRKIDLNRSIIDSAMTPLILGREKP
jgi:hypothetical protein